MRRCGLWTVDGMGAVDGGWWAALDALDGGWWLALWTPVGGRHCGAVDGGWWAALWRCGRRPVGGIGAVAGGRWAAPGADSGPSLCLSAGGGRGLLSAAGAHPVSPVLQRCPHCPAVFSSKSTIKDHVARVHFPVPVQCRLCGKLCANQGVLRVHRSRVHRQRAAHGTDTEQPPAPQPQPLDFVSRAAETRRGEGNA